MSAPRHELYVRRTCQFCAEAEALLDAEGVDYERIIVEDTETPGVIALLREDGRRERIKSPTYFATPTFVDVEAGARLVGLRAIELHVEFL